MKKIITLLIMALVLAGTTDAKVVKRQNKKKKATTTATTKAKQQAKTPIFFGRPTQFINKAEAGDAEAQFELAFCYYWRIGVDLDNSKAMEWAKKSSSQGYSEATELVGRMYHFGIGVAKNEDEANKWFKLAYQQAKPMAEAGDAHAQYTLYMLYYYGRGVNQDNTEARNWLEKSAAQGYHRAQNDLASAYYFNGGYPVKEYFDLTYASAMQGNPFAAVNWADAAKESFGYYAKWLEEVTNRTPENVYKMVRIAAEQGYPRGMLILGLIYRGYNNYDGWHLNYEPVHEPNLVESNRWLKLAAKLGDEKAISWLEAISNGPDDEELNESNKPKANPKFYGTWTSARGATFTIEPGPYLTLRGAGRFSGEWTSDGRLHVSFGYPDEITLKYSNGYLYDRDGRMHWRVP